MDVFESTYFFWGVLLVIGVPFLIIILNELIDRLSNLKSRYAAIACFIRDVVLPLLVLLMVLRLVFLIDIESTFTNLISTLFWVIVSVVIFRFSLIYLKIENHDSDNWRHKIPQLFLRLPPFILIGLIIYHVIENVWVLPIKEMAATLGIGSIAIAFALQSTLSNLVSGFLLVLNSPFKVGDWVTFSDTEGKVVDINWRYTLIENWNGDLLIIPNGSIADEYIENHNRPTSLTLIEHTLRFPFSTPPNDIKKMLLNTLGKTPDVLASPKPAVCLTKLGNPVVEYTVEFWIDDFEKKPDILADCLVRIWYAARRESIAIPLESQEFFVKRHDKNTITADHHIALRKESIRHLPNFAHISEDALSIIAENSSLKCYAATEKILNKGEIEEGVYIVINGVVSLEATLKANDKRVVIDYVEPGGLFGETGLFARAESPIEVFATEDCEILLVSHRDFNQILNTEIKLSDKINHLINQRATMTEKLIKKANTKSATSLASQALLEEDV